MSSLSDHSDRLSPSDAPRAESLYEGRRIDVNSNTALRSLSATLPLTWDDPEMQENSNAYRRHTGLKEDTVGAKKRSKNRGGDLEKHNYDPYLADIPVTWKQMNHYRMIAENSQSELAALRVKYESAQLELLDLRTKLSSKETALHELKAELESHRENNARQSAMLTSLRARVQETEEESGLLATSKSRAEVAMQAILQEKRELKDRLQEMESRLKMSMAQWEDSRSQASKYSRGHGHFLAQLSTCLNVDIKEKENPEQLLASKASDLFKENAELKGEVAALKETVNVHEVESKASRETIMKLVSEVNREKKKRTSYVQQIDALHKNLESLGDAKQVLEKDTLILQERLNASHKAWEASKQELSHLKKSSTELDKTLKGTLGEAKAAHSLLELFKKELAAALSDGSISLEAKEEAILDKIQDLRKRLESKSMVVTQLENRVSKLNEQLQHQADLHQEALLRARKSEQQLDDWRTRLKVAEGELVSGDVMRDNLSSEKQKYMKFLEQLSDKMKLERITADVGFDMLLDVILARADQLVKLESDAVIENKTLAQGLQRKLKAQKERFDSKELHMELLRKKIAQLEEEKQVRTALAVERDEANLTVRKLQKKVERLQKDLHSAQDSVTELKARLSDTNELKIITIEQQKTIEQLNKSVDQLEKVKGKTEKRLLSVKSELDFTEREAKEDKEKTSNYIEVVTSELKMLKKTLEDVSKREKQLLDFREVVSRLLGMNVNALALPDYEIIKRLEGLIHAQHHHILSCA